MLPVYKAISFVKIIQKGARTKPWVVLVAANGDIVPYVVKMFETAQIETRDSVTNEVLGNVLAQQFDLHVPSAALIEMGSAFRETITDTEAYRLFGAKDRRIKFGTQMLDGVSLVQPEILTAGQASATISVEDLFAFDMLIKNRDRTRIKPNLLLKENEVYLIDHELGFEINENTIDGFEKDGWDKSSSQYHLFYKYLSASIQGNPSAHFNSFGEYLKFLDINVLETYLSQLSHHGYSNARHKLLTDYFRHIKSNSIKFV